MQLSHWVISFPEADRFDHRVRRDEIVSPPLSSPPSPDINVQNVDDREAHALLGKLLGFETDTFDVREPEEKVDGGVTGNDSNKSRAEEQEDEFEFRLFGSSVATASKSDSAGDIKTQKLRIRVRSPTPAEISPDDGGFLVPFRGWYHYVTTPELLDRPLGDTRYVEIQNRKRKEYESVAVSGEDVLKWARVEAPGCHLPWRVIHIPSSQDRTRDVSSGTKPDTRDDGGTTKKKKKKPGKKRRIILRKRLAAAELVKKAEAEKRHEKNREKRIKRRQREKERKAAAAAAAGQSSTSIHPGDAPVDKNKD